MVDKERIRAELLCSLEDGVALFRHFQSNVIAMRNLDVASSRKLQVELAKHTGALTEHYLHLKQSKEFAEPRQPDWGHWAVVLWSIDDAIQLAANREPTHDINWGVEPVAFYKKLEKAVHDKSLEPRFSASEFLHWFDQLGDENTILPAALRQAVANAQRPDFRASGNRAGSTTPDANARNTTNQDATEKNLDARERTSLYYLLVHFMMTSAPAKVTQTKEKPWGFVRNSDARKLADALEGKIGLDAIQVNLNKALYSVWESGRAAIERQPKRTKG